MNELSRREATLAALGAVALAVPAMSLPAEAGPRDSVEALKALLKAHDDAFTAHNLQGVLATLSPRCALMGTGPGELWVGHKEIGEAYTQFFKDFDPGKQSFEMLWHDGNMGPMGAWLMVKTKVTMTKGAAKSEFGLNVSIACEKHAGKWLIRGMHFSNLTPASKS